MSREARDDSGGPWEDRRVLRALGAFAGPVALAAFGLFAVRPALEVSHQRLRSALKNARQSEDAALARFRTTEYVTAIRRVRQEIPENASYYLVPADSSHGDYFVRFDLAPRRPILLEKPPAGALPLDAPRWVVLARMDPPGPEVLETAVYVRRGARP